MFVSFLNVASALIKVAYHVVINVLDNG